MVNQPANQPTKNFAKSGGYITLHYANHNQTAYEKEVFFTFVLSQLFQ